MKHVTQWFTDEDPVHKGVYQRNFQLFSGQASYSYWDGKRWCMSADLADQAIKERYRRQPSNFQNIPWRGVC